MGPTGTPVVMDDVESTGTFSAAPAPTQGLIAGVLTGISPESGIDYYRRINACYADLVRPGTAAKRNPVLVLVSIDLDAYAAKVVASDHAGVAEMLCTEGARRLAMSGADFLCIASNTGHLAVPLIEARLPELPVLHIGDCIAAEAKRLASMRRFRAPPAHGAAASAFGVTSHRASMETPRLGLLGTEATMASNSWIHARLADHGFFDVLVPVAETDRAEIFRVIREELSEGVMTRVAREFFVRQIRALYARGAEMIVLGCTEIELLVRPADVADIQLLPSGRLHAEAVARVCAGKATLSDFMPLNCQ